MILKTIAITIFTVWYCAFKDNNVVIVPAPAINGNAIGTNVAARTSFSFLKTLESAVEFVPGFKPVLLCAKLALNFTTNNKVKNK